MTNEFIKYWDWFLKGETPGYKIFWNRWLFLHFFVGVFLAFVYEGEISQAAQTVLLPLAGILIGLTFAWAGNAQALLESEEIEYFSKYADGGVLQYINIYTTAILTILITMTLWGLGGLGVFDFKGIERYWFFPFAIKILLFSISSLALRECWHVVLGTQMMLQVKKIIRRKSKRE